MLRTKIMLGRPVNMELEHVGSTQGKYFVTS